MTTDAMSDPGSPSGHERPPEWYCGALTRSGRSCGHRAGYDTDHLGVGRCKFHGGKTPNHNVAAQPIMIRNAANRLGIPRQVEAAGALIEALYVAAGNVAFYGDLVSRLGVPGAVEAGDTIEVDFTNRTVDVLYAPMRHVSGIPTGEAKPHVLIGMEMAERREMVRVAAEIMKLGLDARRVQIAEGDAQRMAQTIMAVLDDPDLGLTREQRDAGRRIGGRHLRALAGGQP